MADRADKLYQIMDWPRIEAVVYSEEEKPREILGPHVVKSGVLIQGFFPGAKTAQIRVEGKSRMYNMVQEDEEGFFAALLPGKTIPDYSFLVDGEEKQDPYRFAAMIDRDEEGQFCAGIHYEIYNILGAHPTVREQVSGTTFAVWAPNALRVSVVGDFNHWDGRIHQMEKHEDSGIFELFVPEVGVGSVYKYEIKRRDGVVFLKKDPYGFSFEQEEGHASIVVDLTSYKWKDTNYLKRRKKENNRYEEAVAVCEVNLATWMPETTLEERTYKTMAPALASYMKDMGFTHVELMPCMEYTKEDSLGFQTSGYYAPTSRYGTPQDFMYLIDTLHGAGLQVIMDWTPAHFADDAEGMSNFDGTCLYEHLDPRQGIHPLWGSRIYNYGRPQVKNFLIANALFWSQVYHVDGLRMDGVSSILYLDYCRPDGAWIPNIFGSNENLEGIEFLKHLNSIYKKRNPENLLIVEESTNWPNTTGEVSEDCLGFDYKWNYHFTGDLVHYLSCDPLFRKGCHNDLTLSMWYNYMDHFMISLSRDEEVFTRDRLLNKMPGTPEEQLANLRVGYGFMMTHPGKKLFNTEEIFHQEYLKAWLELYKNHPALYQLDYHTDGFQWINLLEAEKNIVSYLRMDEDEKEILLVICNFSNVSYEQYQVGVPKRGKYKEIFNSDAKIFGGSHFVNPRVKMSKAVPCDERDHSITVKVPPLGISVFSFSRIVEEVVDNQTAKRKGRKSSAGNLKEVLAKKVQEK